MATNNATRQPSTLPSQPNHPSDTANAITLRSGRQYNGPVVPEAVIPTDKGVGSETAEARSTVDEPAKVSSEKEKEKEKEKEAEKQKEVPAPIPPKLPFPNQQRKNNLDKQFGKFISLVKSLQVTVPFSDLVTQIPAYSKFLKDILTKKRDFNEVETVAFTEQCSAVIQNRSPPKMKDPGSFSIPCNIGPIFIDKALCDLGASVSVMPLSVCKKLNMDLKCTSISLQMADRSVKYPLGVLEDVPVRVAKIFIPVDFVVLDMEEDANIPIILGRDFLCTAGAVIDVRKDSITMHIGDEEITFNLNLALKGPMLEQSYCRIDIMDMLVRDDSRRSLLQDLLESVLLLETVKGERSPEVDELVEELTGEELPPEEQVFIELVATAEAVEVSKPELKPLPPHLKYAYLDDDGDDGGDTYDVDGSDSAD